LDSYRPLIAILIAVGVLFLYQQLLQWRFPEQYGPNSKQGEIAKRGGKSQPANGAIAPPEASSVNAPTPAAAPGSTGGPNQSPSGAISPGAPIGPRSGPSSIPGMASAMLSAERRVEIDTSFYHVVLTTVGARLASLRLKRFMETDTRDSPLYEMIRPGERLPMGLVVTRAGINVNDAGVDYATDAPALIRVLPGKEAVVTFVAETKDGLRLTKSFTFRDGSYVFDLKGAVAGDPKVSGIGLTISQPMMELPGYRDFPELQAEVAGKVITEDQKPLEKGVQPVSGAITYAGFGDRYFLMAFLPQNPASGTLHMDYADEEADALMLFANPSVRTQVYAGPKELDLLETANPALSKSINFGWSGIIALPFLRALKLFHRIAPNYGVAIILLTIVVRLLTLPMSIKGQRSMIRMQRLQPQVERIREKFKDDQERLNREMVELYKRNNVNPLGGCLPMAVQFPILIGLYEALLNAVELRQAPFVGWIKDLSAPDCLPIPGMPAIPFTTCHGIPVLVLLMAGSALVQQWMSPKQPDPNQQKMMMYMPVVFSLIFIDLPAGLSLYYFASNLLGVVQQFFLNREFKQYTPT
jgi:YidC/Oxa1 family membrane protein insertase